MNNLSIFQLSYLMQIHTFEFRFKLNFLDLHSKNFHFKYFVLCILFLCFFFLEMSTFYIFCTNVKAKGVILPFSHTPTISIIWHPSGVGLSVDNDLATHVTQIKKAFGERSKKNKKYKKKTIKSYKEQNFSGGKTNIRILASLTTIRNRYKIVCANVYFEFRKWY